MKTFTLTAGVLLLAVAAATAQVSVELLLDKEQYLRDEALPMKVRIINRSGRDIKLGRQADWLSFEVESRDGLSVARHSDVPVTEEFTLESSMVASRVIDIAPHYALSQPGRYRVAATLRIGEWNFEASTKAKTFEIVRGATLWEQLVGVPAGGSEAPEVRKYVLQQAPLKRLTLFVRITDENENRTYRLLPIGPLVSFSHPEPQVDRNSNLHLLFQTGARSFSYAVVTPQGELILRQTHDYSRTRPAMRLGEDGRIYIAGGQRRFAADDVPPPVTATSTNNVSSARP